MRASIEDRRLGLTWAFGSAVTGAFFVIPWKLANTAGDPAVSVLLLLALAALVNTALVVGRSVASGRLALRITGADVWVGVLLAAFTLFGNIASARAIQDLSPALLNVVLRAEVILVAVLAWVFLGERVEGRFWVGAAMAVLGLVVLQGPIEDLGAPGFLAAGTGMALAAAVCFSSIAIVTRHFIHRIDPVAANALRLWFAVALWFPFHALPRWEDVPREQVFYAALAAFVGPFLGRIFLMISARYVEARLTTLANLTTPVMTLVLAFLLLSDWPQPNELLGGAIMMVGIAVPLLRSAQDALEER
jgi:drug/metabolite transporter (DMT)-like permease